LGSHNASGIGTSHVTILVTALILTPACGGDITSVGPQRTSGASPSPQASPSPAPSSEEEGGEVAFSAEDGTELIGRLWGDGDVGVVLAHGFSELTGQDDWLPWPGILSEEGYTVLTFNFRGFCSEGGCSGGGIQLGNNWKDVLAAMDFLSSQGAERVFLVGASMGGIAVMRAARDPRVEVAGIVSLSTPQFPAQYYSGEPEANDITPGRLRAIDEPKLFVAGNGDTQLVLGGEVIRFAEEAERMFEAAAEPKDLLIVDSHSHSSELVTVAEDGVVAQTRKAILRFLSENA
jgi:pimeloyl-ACP methyl ester carboxylesterase